MSRFTELSKETLNELEQVFNKIDEQKIGEFLEEIKKANRIFVVGAGREGLGMKAFAMRLMHLGKEVHWLWDDTTPSIKQGDLYICVSGAASLGHLNHSFKMARENGARTAVITCSESGYMIELSHVVLNIPAEAYNSSGDFIHSKQLMGNLFEQSLFLLGDVMVMVLREEMDISKDEMIARHRNLE